MLHPDDLKVHKHILSICYDIAKRSTCCSVNVGACVYDKSINNIFSEGYNGVPEGAKTCNHIAIERDWLKNGAMNPEKRPMHSVWSVDNEVHAEMRAILSENFMNYSNKNHYLVLYCTHSPCYNCCKHLASLSSGVINEIVFSEKYDRMNSNFDYVEYFKQFNIKVKHIPLEQSLRNNIK
ncbi:dCMP deaminase [Morganella phage vB_Mm5]